MGLATLLVGFIFKLSQDLQLFDHEMTLWVICAVAFVAHVLVHYALFVYVVPYIVKGGKDGPSAESYDKAAKETPCTWFTANPVHCLRSKYIYSHSPPCHHYARGLEYLLEPNPDIGLYYSG